MGWYLFIVGLGTSDQRTPTSCEPTSSTPTTIPSFMRISFAKPDARSDVIEHFIIWRELKLECELKNAWFMMRKNLES